MGDWPYLCSQHGLCQNWGRWEAALSFPGGPPGGAGDRSVSPSADKRNRNIQQSWRWAGCQQRLPRWNEGNRIWCTHHKYRMRERGWGSAPFFIGWFKHHKQTIFRRGPTVQHVIPFLCVYYWMKDCCLPITSATICVKISVDRNCLGVTMYHDLGDSGGG
jgi:hypothetical protein